ncbi:MAG TPA: hypothetical protein VKU39_11340, partial [Streptosporangiaceae bacterium]|nr:hypothetical protein [Streptosporangiaceae bacterium]
MRIAVIQDGTELARQTDADISGVFERCCELLAADGLDASAVYVTDDMATGLIEQLDPDAYACVVVASNALNAGRVERALTQGRSRLRSYLDAGGGLVLLQQIVADLSVLPLDQVPGFTERRSPHGAATALDPDDLLFSYPVPVALEQFRDGGLPGPPSLYYRAMPAGSLPDTFKPVLASGDDVLIARSYDHEKQRVVIATPPLDWQRAYDVLANILRFAAFGSPRRLLLRDDSWTTRELLTYWLTSDGGTSVRPMPAPGAGFDQSERWLLRNVELAVVPSACLPALDADPDVDQFLARGGTVVTADQAISQRGRRIVALVGELTERHLAAELYGELRAVTGWDAVDFAFELCNIVLATGALWANPVNRVPMAVAPEELARLRGPLRERLRAPVHREDLSSSIAHAQSLAALSGKPLPEDVYDWMTADPRVARFDVGLQVRAVRALARREPDPAFIATTLAALRAEGTIPVAPLVRVLDTLAVLDQAGLLAEEQEASCELAGLICGVLPSPDGSSGQVGEWLSVEATADVARGLMVLLSRLPAAEAALGDRVGESLGMAVSVLGQAMRQYERNRKGVAWLARIVHTLVEADRRFPVRLRRLADLDWPGQGRPAELRRGTELPLLEYLATENKTLRDRALALEQEQRAARVGRAAATLGVTSVACALYGYLLFLIGFTSVGAVLGSIAILVTILLGLITVVFDLLDRWRLLAGPARRIRAAAGNVPVVSALS